MKPIEFLTDNGGDHNLPSGDFLDALQKPILILAGVGVRAEVLSYYYSEKEKCMVLDISINN